MRGWGGLCRLAADTNGEEMGADGFFGEKLWSSKIRNLQEVK